MFIGITGQIGAGKTTAARILASFGAVVIDADAIGKEVVERSEALQRKLVRAFGKQILSRSGKINRKKLAMVAFADAHAKERLNRLVHPPLLRELKKRMRELAKSHEVVVIDAALLLDWNLDASMDIVLVIHASRRERLRRLMARGIERSDAEARQRAQLPFREYQKRADVVILNNSTEDKLRAKLARSWKKIIPQRH